MHRLRRLSPALAVLLLTSTLIPGRPYTPVPPVVAASQRSTLASRPVLVDRSTRGGRATPHLASRRLSPPHMAAHTMRRIFPYPLMRARATTLVDPYNDRLAIQVGPDGRFNMGAFPDPTTGGATGSSWDLMYRWPEAPRTSFTTLRTDGSDSVFGSSGTQIEGPTDINPTTNESAWQIGDVVVTQTLQIVPNPQTSQQDAARISYTLSNLGTASHQVGLRAMIDTEINYNDGAIYRVPGFGVLSHEIEFDGAAIPDSMYELFSVTDSTHVAASTLLSVGATPPDRLVLASWPKINDTLYDYAVDPTLDFSNDSAYALFWNPLDLAPGQTRTYATLYGLGKLNVDLRPPLALGVTAPAALSVVGETYVPSPFTVIAYVYNNGTAPAAGVNLTLNLPPGLSLASGAATQSVGDLAVGQEQQVSWKVRADSQPSQVVLTYGVTAAASDTESKTLSEQITLPAIVKSTLTLSPASGTDPVGSPHSVTAVATEGSSPDVGRPVTFTVISGPQTGLVGTATTDANGSATFTYSGHTAGTDTIVAQFVDTQGVTQISNTVLETWVHATNTPINTATPATMSIPTDTPPTTSAPINTPTVTSVATQEGPVVATNTPVNAPAATATMSIPTDMPTAMSAPTNTPTSTPVRVNTTSLLSPDIKALAYIHAFDVGNCVADLKSNQRLMQVADVANDQIPTAADVAVVAACIALAASANDTPSAFFRGQGWNAFKATKEYRGYIHLAPMRVTCTNGRVSQVTPPVLEESNLGYTKVLIVHNPTVIYNSGDEYLTWHNQNYTMPRVDTHGTRVVLSDQRASRIADVERRIQYVLIGFDAPFVFTLVFESVACGSSSATPASTTIYIGRTEFPTAHLYINDRLVSIQHQSLGDGGLADFIVHGGTDYHPSGIGPLAPVGAGLTWTQAGSTTTIIPTLGSQSLPQYVHMTIAPTVRQVVLPPVTDHQLMRSWTNGKGMRPTIRAHGDHALDIAAQGQAIGASGATRLAYRFGRGQRLAYQRLSTLRTTSGGVPVLITKETDTVSDRVVRVDRHERATIDETGRVEARDLTTRSAKRTHSVALSHRVVAIGANGQVDVLRRTSPFILGDLLLGSLPAYPLNPGARWSTMAGHALVRHVLMGYARRQGRRVAIIRSTLRDHFVVTRRGASRRTTISETETATFDVAAGQLLASDASATIDLQVRAGNVTVLQSRSTNQVTVRFMSSPSRRNTTASQHPRHTHNPRPSH